MINEQLEAAVLALRKEYNKHITFVDDNTYSEIMENLIKVSNLITSNDETNIEIAFMLMQQVLPDNVNDAIAEIVNTQLIHNRYEDKTLLIATDNYQNQWHDEYSFKGFMKHDVYQSPIPFIQIELSHTSYQAKCFKKNGKDMGIIRFDSYTVISMQIFFKIGEYNYAEFELYYPIVYHFNCQTHGKDEPRLTDEIFSSAASCQLQTDIRQAITVVTNQVGKIKDIDIKVLPFSYDIAGNTSKLEPYTLEILNQITLY
jgi:hypothetical protein